MIYHDAAERLARELVIRDLLTAHFEEAADARLSLTRHALDASSSIYRGSVFYAQTRRAASGSMTLDEATSATHDFGGGGFADEAPDFICCAGATLRARGHYDIDEMRRGRGESLSDADG